MQIIVLMLPYTKCQSDSNLWEEPLKSDLKFKVNNHFEF